MTATVDNLHVCRLPILVGFSGKRNFSSSDEQNGEVLKRLRSRFFRIIAWLDDEFPLTPKVLLCGGDAGADLAIVETVLGGEEGPRNPLWSAIIVSAYADYESDAVEEYKSLDVRHSGRLKRVSLRPLLEKGFDDSSPDGALGKPRQSSGEDEGTRAKFRGGQFDQLGFWLARYSTILFAACGPSTANLEVGAKPGSVSRVVAFRRTALPDPFAADVIARSEELQTGSKLDEPDTGSVFWINSATLPEAETAEPLFTELKPLSALYPQHGAIFEKQGEVRRSLAQQVASIYAAPFVVMPEGAHEQHDTAGWSNALKIVSRFELFHARQLGWRDRCALNLSGLAPGKHGVRLRHAAIARIYANHPEFGAAAPFASSGAENAPFEFLESLRSKTNGFDPPLNRQQSRLAGFLQTALRTVIVLFLCAVFCLENFSELFKDEFGWLLAYIAFIVTIAATTKAVKKLEWGKQAEDLRGLKEVMRVQIAWWKAGIDRMVDRVHLRSIDTDLKTIREMSSSITIWAMLRDGLKPLGAPLATLRETLDDVSLSSVKLASAIGNSKPLVAGLRETHKDWIVSQTDYFYKNWKKQLNFVLLAQQLGRVGLDTAIILLLVLFATLQLMPKDWLAAFASELARPAPLFAAVVGGWFIVAAWTTSSLLGRFVSDHQFWTNKSSSPIAAAAGALSGLAGAALIAQTFIPGNLIPEASRDGAWALSAVAVALTLSAFGIANLEWQTKNWKVSELPPFRMAVLIMATSVSLLGLIALVAPAFGAFAGTNGAEGRESMEPFRALIMASTTLLLTAVGMLRYYVEKRNHLSQTAEYNDCNRAFFRMNELIGAQVTEIELEINTFNSRTSLAPLEEQKKQAELIYERAIEVRRLFTELGEMALDENETWLQAHRERPMEPIAGG